MDILKLYSHEKISERLYIVTENYARDFRLTIPVIVGTERILVVDSGFGIYEGLRKYIESFSGTEMPIFCICTHGHMENIGGADQFDEAYVSIVDLNEKKTDALLTEKRLQKLSRRVNRNEEIMSFAEICVRDIRNTEYKDVRDGDVFHLGEARIEVFGIPGHTAGSAAVIYSHKDLDKYAFCGDAVSRFNCVVELDRDGLKKYREALKGFKEFAGEKTMIYSADSLVPEKMSIVDNIIMACDEILEGNIQGDIPGSISDETEEQDIRVHYVNNTAVQYDAEKLAE